MENYESKLLQNMDENQKIDYINENAWVEVPSNSGNEKNVLEFIQNLTKPYACEMIDRISDQFEAQLNKRPAENTAFVFKSRIEDKGPDIGMDVKMIATNGNYNFEVPLELTEKKCIAADIMRGCAKCIGDDVLEKLNQAYFETTGREAPLDRIEFTEPSPVVKKGGYEMAD